jgi:GNAT superfamily N-acetyltransferase
MSSSHHLSLIDLRLHPDLELLKQFYASLIQPSFSMFGDELEDLDVWESNLSSSGDKYALHVILCLEDSKDLCGGVACEYYPKSQCGLLTYIVTNPQHRNKGVAGKLVSAAVEALEQESRSRGHAGLRALFLETNDSEKISAEEDCMDPAERQRILQRLGFGLLQFQYVQPPLGEGRSSCHDLILCANVKVSGEAGVDKNAFLDWVREFSDVLGGCPELPSMEKEIDQISGRFVKYR